LNAPFLPLLLVMAACLVADAAEPAQKAEKEASPQRQLEGLGFSVAPPEGGKARTSLFGVVGEGYKFVYALDRSGSMEGEPLRAVKEELIRSLSTLGSVHQFQIIFYNHQPTLLNPTGVSGRLAFATEENKRRVERFLDSIKASGGTDHAEAIKAAVRLRPDVIFLLTDGDDPKLTAAQLEKIGRMAAGIVINTVELGSGPKPAGESFLALLARQQGGAYAYIDTSTLATEPAAEVPKRRAGVHP
jgi:secreted protein with Ig-like and vWFA domain